MIEKTVDTGRIEDACREIRSIETLLLMVADTESEFGDIDKVLCFLSDHLTAARVQIEQATETTTE